MNPYNSFSPMYSSYSHYDPNSYQFSAYQNPYPYHHQINDYQFSSSCDPYNPPYSSYNSYNDHTLQNSYAYDDHPFQPYPSQEQTTQSSELHDILVKLNNNSINHKERLQNDMDTFNRIFAQLDNLSKLIEEKYGKIEEENTLDTYEEGETYEEQDNLIINHSDEEEKSKMNDQDLSHQTPLDPIIKHESIFKNDDGVICKKDGDILSFSFKNIEESSEVSDLDSVLDPYSLDYFKDDFIPHLLDDEYDNGDDIISINEENIFDKETKDISIKDVTPRSTLHKNIDIEIKDKFDSHDLNAKDYDLDQSIEKDVEKPSTMLSTTQYTSENVIHDESPLLERSNYEYDDPYMISISNEFNDPPIFSSTHEIIDCEIEENELMTSNSHILADMKIIPNLGSTEKCIEEPPLILSITPPIPEYFIHGDQVLLEEIYHEYHDPYMVPTYTDYHDQSLIRYIIKDMSHLFHIPPSLSCLHHIFIKPPKIFHYSFIISKIKNYTNISLQEKLLPENLDYIHWEDDFPIFILVYDLD